MPARNTPNTPKLVKLGILKFHLEIKPEGDNHVELVVNPTATLKKASETGSKKYMVEYHLCAHDKDEKSVILETVTNAIFEFPVLPTEEELKSAVKNIFLPTIREELSEKVATITETMGLNKLKI